MANKFQIKRGLETNRSGQTPASGEPLWTTDGKKLYVGDGSTAGGIAVSPSGWDKSITIEAPVSGDDITWFFTNRAITAAEIRLVNKETGAGSCVVTIRHGTDRNSTGTVVDTNTVTSNTTGHDVTAISDATIPANSFVWIEIGTTTNTDEVHITMIGTVD